MMLQGLSPEIGNSGDGAASAPPHVTAAAAVGGGASAELASSGGLSEDERGRIEEGGRNSGGNRWPRQETLALLNIRSDMDVAFRDSSLKGPLWDEISRKLAELGYHRSGKKCKEKFENVYKYNKRTKENRISKSDGKTYKFFDQLQAMEANPSAAAGHHQPPPPPVVSKPPQIDPISVAAPAFGGFPFSQLNSSASTNSSSSSTDDEEPPPSERRRNRKRKWKEFFGKLIKEVIGKQEELQSRFLDTLERRERDRIAREEAWRLQEMSKMKREHDLLVQERSMSAAKDAAVITFLQKITEKNTNVVIPQMPAMQLLQQQQQNHSPPPQPSRLPPPILQQPQPQPQPQQQAMPPLPVRAPIPVSGPASVPVSTPALPPPSQKNLDNGGGGENTLQPSPSRWPKAEINALINLRTTLDMKYQENGPKGPLWEEISSAMRKLGYNRNSKRCKEKWENINKYYKKVKESTKKRPDDSKTCPYFHQLDAIYREKAIMARPEQQWPLPAVVQDQQQQQKKNEPTDINHNENAYKNGDDYDDKDYDDDEEDDGANYEMVPNTTSSMAAVE